MTIYLNIPMIIWLCLLLKSEAPAMVLTFAIAVLAAVVGQLWLARYLYFQLGHRTRQHVLLVILAISITALLTLALIESQSIFAAIVTCMILWHRPIAEGLTKAQLHIRYYALLLGGLMGPALFSTSSEIDFVVVVGALFACGVVATIGTALWNSWSDTPKQ
jgi:hypothetical protein